MSKVFKAIGNVVSGVVKAVGSVVKGVVNAVGGVISGVLNFVMTPFLGLFGLGAPSLPSTATPESLTGVLIQTQGSSNSVPVLYGYRKIAGTVVFAETGSDTNKYLWVAYALSEGAVEGLKEVWIDDTQLPAENIPKLNNGAVVTVSGNSIDPKTGASTACKFNKLTTLQFWSGLHYSNPASTNVGNVIANNIFAGSPSWTRDMNYNGCATIFARYEWPTDTTNNPFGGGIPTIQVCMLGRQVTGLISGSPENYDYGNFSGGYAERYSTNPAEIVLDYLRNPNYGKGLKNSDIDWTSFKIAAAKCNTDVEYYNGVRGPILTLNYVVKTDSTLFNNTKDMLSNFRAYLPFSNGKYKLIIEDAGDTVNNDILSGSATIAATFDKNNIQGEITYTGIERSVKYNAVKVNYTDPDNSWSTQTVTYPETVTDRYNYYVLDGYRENVGEFTCAGITNPYIAKDMARLIFNKSRWQDSINLTVSSQAFELEPGDNIYIDSNILKFGTDPNAGAIPWRIISSKLNNDYTFTLGCVRNPDFIYPHVRAGEIDYEMALFIPKGATRYYPPEPSGIPVGVHPPTFAPRDTGATTNPVTTPTVTTPTGSTGGGVGGTTGSVNTGGTNTPATPSKPAPVLNDFITILSATYSTVNGAVYATLQFLQPSNVNYASTTLYYKRNSSVDTVYTQKDVLDKPGAGKTISVQIGPLINGQTYKVSSIVKYTTGESSTITDDAYFLASSSGTQTNLLNTTTTVAAGWTLPTTPLPNDQKAQIGSIVATPVLTGGHPTTPRSLSITFGQDINTFGINTYANALQVLYRQSPTGGSTSYWNEYTYNFDSTYAPGVTIPTFTLSGLGISAYPNPATAQTYDFIFRFKYKDSKASLYQWRVMNAAIEYNGIGYSFNVFATSPNASNVIPIGNEPIGNYTPELLSAHPEAVVDYKLITIGLYSASTYNQSVNSVRFFFNPPDVTNRPYWYGVRIYYRKIVPGSNPVYSVLDVTPPTVASTGEYSAVLPNLDYSQSYQYIIVPLVESSGKVEATYCWFGQGQINQNPSSASYPSDANWFTSLGFKSMLTTTALTNLSTSFSLVDPTVTVTQFKRTNISTISHAYNSWYYTMKIQVPTVASGFEEMYIYRRSYQPFSSTAGYAPYFGVGRWEKITVTTSSTNANWDSATSTFTVNLRGPTSYKEFGFYYSIIKGSSFLNPPPVSGGAYAATSETHQFFIVIKTSGTVSTYGMLLPVIAEAINYTTIDGLLVNSPTKLAVSDFNNYSTITDTTQTPNVTDSSYRNLSDARNALANSLVYTAGGGSVVPPTTTPGVV